MPKTDLTNDQIVELTDAVKQQIGSKAKKSDVVETTLQLLEDIIVSDETKAADQVWQYYKYKKLPKVETKKVTKKKIAKKTDKETNVTKMDIAIDLMTKFYGEKTRKEIIEMLMNEAGLTQAGASTYYYNIKKKYKLD